MLRKGKLDRLASIEQEYLNHRQRLKSILHNSHRSRVYSVEPQPRKLSVNGKLVKERELEIQRTNKTIIRRLNHILSKPSNFTNNPRTVDNHIRELQKQIVSKRSLSRVNSSRSSRSSLSRKNSVRIKNQNLLLAQKIVSVKPTVPHFNRHHSMLQEKQKKMQRISRIKELKVMIDRRVGRAVVFHDLLK